MTELHLLYIYIYIYIYILCHLKFKKWSTYKINFKNLLHTNWSYKHNKIICMKKEARNWKKDGQGFIVLLIRDSMRRFLLTSDTIDFMCLVYSNFNWLLINVHLRSSIWVNWSYINSIQSQKRRIRIKNKQKIYILTYTCTMDSLIIM